MAKNDRDILSFVLKGGISLNDIYNKEIAGHPKQLKYYKVECPECKLPWLSGVGHHI